MPMLTSAWASTDIIGKFPFPHFWFALVKCIGYAQINRVFLVRYIFLPAC